MKKTIPKFDQKAWDEKQAKSAENYSKGGINFAPYIGGKSFTTLIPSSGSPMYRRAGSSITITNNSPGTIFLNPAGMSMKKYDAATGRWILVGDENDQYIFSGDSEDTMQLPKGYHDQTGFDWASTGASNPKKTNCDLGIHEYTNVGFHHDKFVCKNCDKEQEK